MGKWAKWGIFAALVAVGTYYAYGLHRAGFFTRPDMPDGAFSLSFKGGFFAILVDIPNEKSTRTYLGFPAEVPFYLEDAWSLCHAPSEDEQEYVSTFMKGRPDWPGERFEALCKIKVENEFVVRGLITSVPKV